MRKLTITRAKSSVGCLVKVKFYIEDHSAGNVTINNIPCRFLGAAKNGETKTFEIDDNEVKIFAIDDKLTKGFANDYYQIPEGSEDIELSGARKFNLASTNAFRFDNNNSEGIAEHRERNNRKGIAVLVVAFIIGMLIGRFGYKAIAGGIGREKTFESEGMSITLTNKFKEMENDRFPIAYTSNYMAVFAVDEPFYLLYGFEDYTLYQYANLVINANGLKNTKPETVDGLVCFEYEKTVDKKDYIYYAYVYKSDDAFWLVQFSVEEKNAEKYESYIRKWAATVEFE